MADGVARSTGRPGVICIVPGPGVTNSLTGIGEALLDSVPIVCIVGDVARGDKYKPFQVHEMPQVGLIAAGHARASSTSRTSATSPAPCGTRSSLAMRGEPGPTAVVVPYNLLTDTCTFDCPPLGPPRAALRRGRFRRALQLLSYRGCTVGIYAGMGCMDFSAVADAALPSCCRRRSPPASPARASSTSAIRWPSAGATGRRARAPPKTPSSMSMWCWPSASATARFQPLSTRSRSTPHIIHVDINPNNIGRIVKTEVCVNADAGVFLDRLLDHADEIRRPPNDDSGRPHSRSGNARTRRRTPSCYARCGVDPMAFILALRKATCPDALTFVDVTCRNTGRPRRSRSSSRAPTSTRPTTSRWAGRSRRRSGRSASTPAGRS